MDARRRSQFEVITAYAAFGVLPIFWRTLHELPPEQVLLHRTLWACVLLGVLLGSRARFEALAAKLFTRYGALCILSAALLGANWLTYLYALQAGRFLEASLGYFLAPICSVALGAAFCNERLTPRQLLAVALLVAGVSWKALATAHIPWIALALAVSFSLYTLVRKKSPFDASEGLFVETVLLLPLAALVWRHAPGEHHFWTSSFRLNALLLVAGVVTALPMVWLMRGAKNVSMQFLGLSQYVSPSLSLVVATAVYGEPLHSGDLVGFALIWSGIALFLFASRAPQKETYNRAARSATPTRARSAQGRAAAKKLNPRAASMCAHATSIAPANASCRPLGTRAA